MLFIFSTPVLIRHLQQLKTVVFLDWCLKRAVLLFSYIVYNVNVKTFFYISLIKSPNKLGSLSTAKPFQTSQIGA
jgi:hypothetical protein